jgi:hypothetical protein
MTQIEADAAMELAHHRRQLLLPEVIVNGFDELTPSQGRDEKPVELQVDGMKSWQGMSSQMSGDPTLVP